MNHQSSTINIVFFGSFLHYSTKIAHALKDSTDFNLVGVVTTPPMPAGRNQELQKTHTHLWAEENSIPIFTPTDLGTDPKKALTINHQPSTIDLFVVAGYGKLLPESWLKYPNIASLNVHFSLLPKFRGANPAEWAILLGETETGITLMQMDAEFDTGNIIAQAPIDIEPQDTRESLYEKLYDLAASCLEPMLSEYLKPKTLNLKLGLPQPTSSPTPPAYRFTRSQSFIPWDVLVNTMQGKPFDPTQLPSYLQKAWHISLSLPSTLNPIPDSAKEQLLKPAPHRSHTAAQFINNCIRALAGFPGVWTYIPTTKGKQRLKILSAHIDHQSSIINHQLVLDQVQLEGKIPSTFNQIKNLIIDLNPKP